MHSIKPYEHRVQYYETDQMGVVHHSNYIRWFEEARTDFMEQMGLGYDEMERRGILSPVLGVQADYRRMVHFGETVTIKVSVQEYNGIKLAISYEVTGNETGELHCTGETRHCFLTLSGKPISLKRDALEFHDMFSKCLEDHSKKENDNE